MTSSELAILGGSPVRSTPFPSYKTIGEEEKHAAMRVLTRGVLSDYLGKAGARFLGGAEVRALEEEWFARFRAKHAVSVNSATSGIYAAIGAAGVGPGDEVIVSPFTMSASAVGPMIYGAKPVFADIDPETFCISAKTIERVLTKKTRAVVVVDLFGQPADTDPIMKLAAERGLTVIEDAAQAAGATYGDRWAGTLTHMGVFSLNVHKIIQSGEGGVVVTDDDRLAERLRLVRNHGEVVARDLRDNANADIIGFNYRMTEVEAAVAREQLKKLDGLAEKWIANTNFLREKLAAFEGLRPAAPRDGSTSVYYQLAIHYDAAKVGVPRDRFVEAVRAEGIPLGSGYVEPLYFQPLYEHRFPGDPAYLKGTCPVAESMWFERLITTSLNHACLSRADLEDVVDGIAKVWSRRADLNVKRGIAPKADWSAP